MRNLEHFATHNRKKTEHAHTHLPHVPLVCRALKYVSVSKCIRVNAPAMNHFNKMFRRERKKKKLTFAHLDDAHLGHTCGVLPEGPYRLSDS